jgi:hypothetical protein
MIVVYVAEIAGSPVFALNAPARDAAEATLAEPGVQLDLQQFHAGGQPLWNGVDEIVLRDPTDPERAMWEASFFKAIRDRGAVLEDALQETWICMLVAVSPPAAPLAQVSPLGLPPPGRWPSIGRTRRSGR